MTIADQVKDLQQRQGQLPSDFRQQIDSAAAQKNESGGDAPRQSSKGVDRSREFRPVERPSNLRILVRN